MKPPSFEYEAPGTVEGVLEILADRGREAKVLAGGQSLVPLMNFRMAKPGCLVDINGLRELDYIEQRTDGVAIGATVRQRAVEQSGLMSELCPLVVETLSHVGHPQIRNQGTFVGNLVHGDPSSELPAVALMKGAKFTVAEAGGKKRRVEAKDFFISMFNTDVDATELVTEVEFPSVPENTRSSFQEIALREGDFALAGAGVMVNLNGGGEIEGAKIGLCGVSDGPMRASTAESFLKGNQPGPKLFEEAGKKVSQEEKLSPPEEMHGSDEYRKEVVGTLVQRALTESTKEERIR